MLLDELGQFFNTSNSTSRSFQAEGTAVAVRARGPHSGKQQGREQVVKTSQVTNADIAECVAVIGRLQRQVLGFLWFRLRTLLPVLEGHLQGDLDGGGPVVGIEDPRQTRR